MGRSRVSTCLVLIAMGLEASASAISAHNLFGRASTCATTGFSECTEAGLSSSFCCPQSSTCIPLASNTTVLCCPSGDDCTTIQAITCDLSQQNITAHPASTLQTTALTSQLVTCGTGCCPFGYSCNTNGQCVMNANQQNITPPAAVSSSSSATAITPSSTSSSSTQTAAVAPVTASATALAVSCNKFPVTAVLVGFFPGVLAGALLTMLGIALIGACRRKSGRRNSGSSFGNISDPQPGSNDMRTDFLRKAPQTPSTGAPSTPTRRNTVTRMRSLFRKSAGTNGSSSPRPAPPVPLVIRKSAGQNEMTQQPRPVTPQRQREPSFEDINIFADGDTASALRQGLGIQHSGDPRASHQTTFTDMMEKSGLAGLQKGQPYVYKPSSPEYQGRPSEGSRAGSRGRDV